VYWTADLTCSQLEGCYTHYINLFKKLLVQIKHIRLLKKDKNTTTFNKNLITFKIYKIIII